MPELEIRIGGRAFQVACQEGEEGFLQAAAALLDAEAQPLVAQAGRLPEARLLLMAGLMLADRMAGLTDQARQADARAEAAEARMRHIEAHLEALQGAPLPEPMRVEVEVPVLPAGLLDRLAELAAQAEAVAQDIEDRVAAD